MALQAFSGFIWIHWWPIRKSMWTITNRTLSYVGLCQENLALLENFIEPMIITSTSSLETTHHDLSHGIRDIYEFYFSLSGYVDIDSIGDEEWQRRIHYGMTEDELLEEELNKRQE